MLFVVVAIYAMEIASIDTARGDGRFCEVRISVSDGQHSVIAVLRMASNPLLHQHSNSMRYTY